MRVLWLSHFIPYPPKIGAIHRSYHLLKHIAKENEVVLLAFNQNELMNTFYADPIAGKATALRHLGEICEYVEVLALHEEISRFGKKGIAAASVVSSESYTMKWLKSRVFSERLSRILKDYDFDVVHMDTISFMRYADQIEHPIVLNHHNIESQLIIRRGKLSKNLIEKVFLYFEGIKLQNEERKSAKQAARHVVCSDLDSERLREVIGAAPIDVIPNGVEPRPLSAVPSEEPPRLVFLGTLSWGPNRKAVEWIVEDIWPCIRASGIDVNFELVGGSPPDVANRLSIEDSHFHVRGFVDEIDDFMHPGNIFVCPIVDGGGTKLKVLDSFERGMPVVAHPIAMEGINAIENVHYVPALNAREFADRIAFLLNSPEERERLSRHGRELVISEYSYASIAEKLSIIYSSTAKDCNSSS